MTSTLDRSVDKARCIAEVRSLLTYAAERKLFTAGTAEATDTIRKDLLEPLAIALQQYETCSPETEHASHSRLLFYYSALNKLTGDVTGRSYIDSTDTKGKTRVIVYTSLVVLGLTVALELTQRSGVKWPVTVYPFLGPLAWGALGSCLYLLKSLSDKAADFQFDCRLINGIPTRITIGAILGLIIVQLFDLQHVAADAAQVAGSGGQGDSGAAAKVSAGGVVGQLSLPAAAFMAGLGAKVIYGALENVLEALAERLTFSG